MRIINKILLTFFLILIIVIFIHPRKVIEAPKITGKVIDENGNSIKDAFVTQIEELSIKNELYGNIELKEYKSHITKSDINGIFKFSEKSRIEWIHSPFDLFLSRWCFGNFEVTKDGFEIYKTKFGEFRSLETNLFFNEEIEFKPVVTLKKLN